MKRPKSLRIPTKVDASFGRLIDRSRPLSFTFDGRPYYGFKGDSLASALLANCVRTIGHSLKYHRPRGIFGIGVEDPNALVDVGTGDRRTPNLLATSVPLQEGMVASSQNSWHGLGLAAAWLLERSRPLIPAGFQYKTMKSPLKAWPIYENLIRKAAGLGKSPQLPDPDRYEHVHLRADVLIVGGGIAGMAAAEAAAAHGLTVVLVEQSHRLGGIADAYNGRVEGKPLLDWVRNRAASLAASSNIHILTRTSVAGLYDHGLAVLVERLDETPSDEPENMPRERLWKLRTRAVVLATGAFEKPLVFPENDRPGVMLATSARLYIRRYGVLPGTKIVIATAGDEGYRTVFDLIAAGASIERVVDLRLHPDGALFHIAKSRGLSISVGSAPVGTGSGRGGVLSGVDIANRLTLDGPALRGSADCDTLLVSGGWSPAPALAGHLGARLKFDPELGCFRPGDLPSGLFVAGAANALFDVEPALEDGWRAGAQAAAHVRGTAEVARGVGFSVDVTQDDAAEPVGMLPDISTPQERMRAFVDLQNDVSVGDMEIAIREGYGASEHLKRYTALGLGTDQGKTGFANAAAIHAKLAGLDPANAAHTTFRPPWTPVSFGVLAGPRRGPLFQPVRETALSKSVIAGVTESLGPWRLPAYFPRPGESREEAVRREVRGVRGGIGIFDSSASAKIMIAGPDAEGFLNRVSATDLANIETGSSRYALFLNENGFLQEDAVIARLGEHRFLLSAGLARAAPLAAWFERWHQREWPDLDVHIVDETERWGQVLLAGPRVPELVKAMPTTIDIAEFSADSFAEGEIFGVPARALASRYTAGAEVELSIPAGHLPAFWDWLVEAGAEFGILPFGTETMHRLRLEAGAFDLDRETDGSVTPFDLGLGDLIATRKDFVGRKGLSRPALVRANRRHLVGILMEDASLVPPPGAHLVSEADHPPPRRTVGHVTSSGFSPTLRRSIALALVAGGERHIGDQVFIVISGEGRPARIAQTDFLSLAEETA